MADKFYVTIPVKPYVKRFIELNYGLPADFSKHSEEMELVCRCLKKPRTRHDKYYENLTLETYSEKLEIVISQHLFYHYGWEFSLTDIVSFGRHFEKKAKNLLKWEISAAFTVNEPIKNAITEFKERTGFDEDHWQYESIVKEFQRNGKKNQINFKKQIKNQMLINGYEFMLENGVITEVFFKKVLRTLSFKKDNIAH